MVTLLEINTKKWTITHKREKGCYTLTHGLQDELVLSDSQRRLNADGQLRGLDDRTGLHLHLERGRQVLVGRHRERQGSKTYDTRKCREIKQRKG